jgi:hypothetical protein
LSARKSLLRSHPLTQCSEPTVNRSRPMSSLTQSALAGQNTAPPGEKLFLLHFVLQLSNASNAPVNPGNPPNLEGPYFDPSYGVWYSGPADFESKAIFGYAAPLSTFRYKVRPPGPLPGGGCSGPQDPTKSCLNVMFATR